MIAPESDGEVLSPPVLIPAPAPAFDGWTVEEPAPFRPPRRRSVLRIGVALSLIFVVALGVLFAYPIPRHIRLSPGPSPDVKGFIKIDGATVYQQKARLGVALVLVSPVDNLFELARSSLDRDSEVHERRDFIPPSVSDQQNDRINRDLMTTSQQDATYVALKYLGYDVKIVKKGARVTAVVDNSPAARVLQPGDVVVSVDGTAVQSVDEVGRLVRARTPGDRVKLGILRNGAALEVELTTVESSTEKGRPIIGAEMGQEQTYELPPGLKVDINTQDIGGPSAGLAMTLGVIDLLTPGDISGGHNIGATGTIALDGTVGRIGGGREKAIGVERAGAEYFLVPKDDAAEAQQGARRMKIVPVGSLQEALDFLKTLRNGQELQSPAA